MHLEQQYIETHSEPEHPYLHALWRATHLHLNYPRMASGHLQGEVLRMLVLMLRPQRVLEIGTFTGYSALAMASAMEPGTMLHTIEINDEQEDFTRPWIENSPWADRITFHIGDALTLLSPTLSPLPTSQAPSLSPLTAPQAPTPSPLTTPQASSPLPSSFDLVFIDADKRHYVEYYEAVLLLVRPGGFILADNTLWGGQVYDAEASNGKWKMDNGKREMDNGQCMNAKSSQLQGIMAFNDLVAADSRVEKVILPLRDGLTLIYKKPF